MTRQTRSTVTAAGPPTLDVSGVEQTFSDGAPTLRDHRFERDPGRFGNIVTPLEMRQEHLLQRASRSEIRSFVYIEIRSFVYIRIAAGEVVQDPTLLPGRSVRCGSALRRRADKPRAAWQSGHGPDTHRAPASRFLPTGITAHSFPGNILGAPGSGARRGLRRNTVATSPGLTKRPEWKDRWPRCAACQSVLRGRSTLFPSRCCADGPIVAAADPAAWPLGSGEVAAEAPGCYAGSPVEVAGADRAAPVASRRRRRRGSACRTATDRMRQWPQRRPGRIAAEVVADARV
jgi:hypothetical protein